MPATKGYKGKKGMKKKSRNYKNKKMVRKPRVYRDPFPQQVRRRLSYAFRTTVTPPSTSVGGFSIAQQTFLLNSCYDPDKSVANTGLTGLQLKSSRINHQPMGFDQLMTLYSKYLVTYARVNANFAFEKPTAYVHQIANNEGGNDEIISDNTPCRVGYITSDGDDLPSSLLTTGGNLPTMEKLIEQARSGQLTPKSAQFRYRTLRKDGVQAFSFGVNPFKFAKVKNGATWSEYKENNLAVANSEPGALPKSDPCYCHLFVSPLTTQSGDSHSPVVVYGTIDFDVMCTDLQSLSQS